MSTLNPPISTSKVFFFKFNIEDYFILIRAKFFPLALIECVPFFETTSTFSYLPAKFGNVRLDVLSYYDICCFAFIFKLYRVSQKKVPTFENSWLPEHFTDLNVSNSN